jgi:hypothetical protein
VYGLFGASPGNILAVGVVMNEHLQMYGAVAVVNECVLLLKRRLVYF